MVKLSLDKINNGTFLRLIPSDKKEFQLLITIWKEFSVFEKKGCCIHSDAITQHGIENSDFVIEITK